MNPTDAISIVMAGIKDGSISLVSGDGLVTPKKPRARWSKYIPGTVFGSLKLIELAEDGKWLVECLKCGAHIERGISAVVRQMSKCDCSPKKNEHLVENRFGSWILREKNGRRWTVECVRCGNTIERSSSLIVAGRLKCVCHPDFDARGSMVGRQEQTIAIDQRFGNLFVREMLGTNDQGENIYQCKCLCGNDKIVTETELLSGHTTHCGCKTKEKE